MLNFIPEHFKVLKTFLNSSVRKDGLPNTFNSRTARIIGEYITMSSIYEYQCYPRNAKNYLMHRGIISNDLVRNGQIPLNCSQLEELKALANISNRELAKISQTSKSKLIFNQEVYFRNCHASTVLPLEDGTILVAYFAGTKEGDSDVGIWLSIRIKGKWQKPIQIAKTEQIAYWNPVLFETANGIRIVYKVGETIPNWHSRTMTSQDQGRTWSSETCYPEPNKACGPVRSKPLLMSNGRLLAPNSDETLIEWAPRVDISDDYGKSFKTLSTISINQGKPEKPNFVAGKGAIQPTLWESSPGNIHMLMRTTCGNIFRSDSKDYGHTWCQAYNTYLPNNNSGFDIAMHGKNLYLVFNPVSGNWAARTPIVIYSSINNGVSFEHYLTLESLEIDETEGYSAEFSYPAAVVRGDTLYVTFTYMRRQIAFHEIQLGCE